MYKPFGRIVLQSAIVVAFLLPIPSFASSTFTFSGSFTQDDNLLLYQFTISAPTTVTLESFSYGGNGSTVNPGGFAPVLSLFGPVTSGDPNLINFDDGGTAPGGCGARLIDPTTNLCLDADLTEALTITGTYLVALTENDNTPNGPDFLAGFNEAGNGNFTGTNEGFPGESFLDPLGNQRTPNYDFTITGADSATELPEPSTMSLLIAGAGLLAGLRARRRR
jgi:hypothetical protein